MFEGPVDAEEIMEDGILHLAASFDHKGVSPCGVREMAALRKECRAREGGILVALRRGGSRRRRLGDEGRPQKKAGKDQEEERRRPPSTPRQRRPRAAAGSSAGCERQDGRRTQFYALLSVARHPA